MKVLPNKGMKLTSVEHIGRSQLIPGVRPTSGGAMRLDATIYASLAEHLNEGFVWLRCSGIPARCIVKISNAQAGKSVYCEALQIEDNFLDRYNRAPRIPIENPDSALVISAWYRARLGGLETKQAYGLDIEAANGLLGKTRASMQHPQNVVRIGIWLGVISVALGALGLVLGLLSLRSC